MSLHAHEFCVTPALQRRFIPAKEYLAHSAAVPGHLEWLLRTGRARVHRKSRDGREEVLIDLDGVARYKETLVSYCTEREVADCLAIGIDDVAGLVRHGCLMPVSGPSVDRLPIPRFSRDQPEQLLCAVGVKAMSLTGDDQREWMSWGSMLSLLRRHKIGVGRFIRDVLNGKSTPRFDGRAGGLHAFAFGKKEIVEYVFSKTGEMIITHEKSAPTFRQLARALEKMRERNNNAYTRGLSQSEETGDSNWVSGSDLARVAARIFSRTQANQTKNRPS